jgi:ferric-dicitrate binding protein FerR (iron transport regulator)
MNNENSNHNIQDDPEFKEIWDLAGSYKFKEAEGNDKAWEKFQNAVQPKAKLTVTYSRTRILAYAAVIGLFVLSGIVLFKFNSNSKTLLLVSNNVTMAGEMKELKLADGSIITMNGASNVSYELKADQRRIKLKGQAHFEVAPNKYAPFIIETDKGTITVLGTGFDVIAYPNKELSVSVNHGKVSVENNSKKVILTKGMSAKTNGIQLTAVAMDSTTVQWRGQFLSFNEANVSSVVETIENKYNVSLKGRKHATCHK